ncbi:7-deoxyloganetic acid glucosyltransferase [Bertholletia excelsa]
MADPQALAPHVLVFPLPLQGPVKAMLKLTELLCLVGIQVTFLVTDHILGRLLRHTDIQSHFARYAGFRLVAISDGLADDHPRLADQFMELMGGLKAVTMPLFREKLASGGFCPDSRPPVTCVIADGMLGFAIEVSKEIGLPIICSTTISPCFLWVIFCLPELIEAGELPIGEKDLDGLITIVPGMEGVLRRRDLPSFCRSGKPTDPNIQLYLAESKITLQTDGLILNSFEDLEGPVLAHIRSLCPNLYTIGPLYAHLKSRLAEASAPSSFCTSSFRQEDRSCLTWLDQQPEKCVIYVSFGSLVPMTTNQLMEFWHGLVNADHRFLWVIRPDSLGGREERQDQIPPELREGTEARGYIVEWAPQEEVLAHRAVAAFLTHSGWNSTLESVYEGVPMICWPYFVDQQVNSRYVDVVWKLGLDMKDTCDRAVIERTVKDLMDVRKSEFRESADGMASLARKSVMPGGSSWRDLDRLVKDIRSTSLSGSQGQSC